MEVIEAAAVLVVGLILGFFAGYFSGWEVCTDYTLSLHQEESDEPADTLPVQD